MIWTGSLSRVFVYLAVVCNVFASIQLLPSSRKVGGWVGGWVTLKDLVILYQVQSMTSRTLG
jgi:hypothetical protein